METDYKSMLDRVMTFVSDRLGVEKSKMTEQTLIEDDFGIAGLDTRTFYEEFFTKFGISNPTDFNADQYVTSENMQIGIFIKSLFSTTTRKTFKIKSVSLKHLTNVALRRKWYEQYNYRRHSGGWYIKAKHHESLRRRGQRCALNPVTQYTVTVVRLFLINIYVKTI